MKMPDELISAQEWVLVGPMGPALPEKYEALRVLGVDGGANFTPRMDLWVGDSDSYFKVVQCPHIFKFPPEKDSSDLCLALKLFEHLTQGVIHMWGFLGGRLDHELLNLGAVMSFLENKSSFTFHFYDSSGTKKLSCFAGGVTPLEIQGTFSLITMKPVRVKLLGACKYPIENEIELGPFSSLGLSNIGRGKMVLQAQGPVMVVRV
jgi:thiamine pyrophosphokinase